MNSGKKEVGYQELRTGDLLFSTHPYCSISQAIDLVTQTGKGTHFSHIGVVECIDDSCFVYHSTPGKGVCRQDLEYFLHPDQQENRITVYRLKEAFQSSIPMAMNLAKDLVGQPYNNSFKFTAPGYYCSEFIYRIFAPSRIFELNPMTFKDPESNDFSEHWIEYYGKLGISVPERQPGCNPNGMAASDKLVLIGILNF
jgi:uncharacterized protein YycO